jgi:hypothetical protein
MFVDALRAGLNPLRVSPNKTPIGSWKHLQKTRLLPALAECYDTMGFQPGIVCGVISGGLEVLDFDVKDRDCFGEWWELVATIASRCPIIETPSGGRHIYYRCKRISPNTRLAVGDTAVRIETRGEGGYVVAPGGPLRYMQNMGPPFPESVPTLSTAERAELWRAALQFDTGQGDVAKRLKRERARRQRVSQPGKRNHVSGDRPSDRAKRLDWCEILEPFGWTQQAGNDWTRPGKSSGLSARVVLADNGDDLLTIFSTSASPLESGHTYGKFEALATLHGLDWGSMARVLQEKYSV